MINHLKRLYYKLMNPIRLYRSAKRQERELKDKYYHAHDSKKVQQPSFVFMVDGRSTHGGLSDRLRAMVTIYTYCKERNIPFYIHHVYPFKLEDYLNPNKVQWVAGEDDISYDPDKALPALLNSHEIDYAFHKLILDQLVRKGKQIHIYSNSRLYDEYFSENFQTLFKPSSKLQAEIEHNLEGFNSQPYVAMVFRFQQLLGDFKEWGNPPLPESDRKKLINKCIAKLEEVHSQRCPGKQVLVTSDSVTFLHAVNKLEYVHIIPGKVVHIDFTQGEKEDVYLKSFIDFFMVANAERVFMLRTDNMFHTHFPHRASMVYGRPYEEIEF